jgi:hypothetical protein
VSPPGEPLQPPERLTSNHRLDDFDSGSLLLDDWLRRRALRNETDGASRTYVVCRGTRVIAFYSLAIGAVLHADTPRRRTAHPAR